MGARTDRWLGRWDKRNQQTLETQIEPTSFDGPGVVLHARNGQDIPLGIAAYRFFVSIDGGERQRGVYGWACYPLSLGCHSIVCTYRPGLLPTVRHTLEFELDENEPVIKLDYVSPIISGGSLTFSSR